MWNKVWSMFSNFPLLNMFPVTKFFVKKWLKNCEKCTFTPRIKYLTGENIYAKNVNLWGTFFQDLGKIEIGENTIFWYENMILTAGYKDTESLLQDPIIKDVKIWKNCWITSRCIILGGVTIWDHVIVWGGSVVTKNVPSYSFVAGNPAKVIKSLQ